MPTAASIGETAEAGRAALGRHAWREAYELLSSIRDAGVLAGEDLEGLAQAAWWCGRMRDAIAIGEQAYAAFVGAGDEASAARVALTLAKDNHTNGAPAVGGGWLARAERLLGELPETVVHGYLARLRAMLAFEGARDLDTGLEHAAQALRIAETFGDRDLAALALHDRGRILVDAGEVAAGLALIDEATAAAVSGELRPLATGVIYCNTIGACEHMADYARAGEWTEAAKRWCERQSIAGFPGLCRVHHATIMRLRGAWVEAEEEARRACSELADFSPVYAADGFYEIGEIRLRAGDLAGAEEAFRQAQELGREPQPGMALLLLAHGRLDAAESAIRRALAQETLEVLRARLLPARAEIAVARHDVAGADEAASELASTAARFGTPALTAMAATARGLVELERGAAEDAIAALRIALGDWKQVDAPYEAARVRVDLARAHIGAGDEHAAAEEFTAARSAFARLGAEPDARRAEELLARIGGSKTTRHARTFMFTDICGSTALLEAIGDEAWQDLVRWHDARCDRSSPTMAGTRSTTPATASSCRFRARRPPSSAPLRSSCVSLRTVGSTALRRSSGSGSTRRRPRATAVHTAARACTRRRGSQRWRLQGRSWRPARRCEQPGWRPASRDTYGWKVSPRRSRSRRSPGTSVRHRTELYCRQHSPQHEPRRGSAREGCGLEAIAERLKNLQRERRRLAQQLLEVLARDEEYLDGRARHHRRSPRGTCDQADLAEEVASPERAQQTRLAADVDFALQEDEEAVVMGPLADQTDSLRVLSLRRDRGDPHQLSPRSPGEQRHFAQQFDLFVLAQPHGRSLGNLSPIRKQARPHERCCSPRAARAASVKLWSEPESTSGEEDEMNAKPGDRIVVESERAGQPARTGVIEEVVGTDPARYRVRWDDRHTSTFTPASGVARIETVEKRKAPARARSRS